MNRKLTPALTIAVLTASLAFAYPQQTTPPSKSQDQPSITVPVDRVNVVFTVTNRRNKLVTDLSQGDFRVFEDGTEREISNFSRETDLPLRIGLMLDTSNSIRGRLEFEQNAAIDFLHNVLRRNKDMAFLMTFDAEPAVLHPFTDDIGALQQKIEKLRAGGGTSLYDSIYYAAEHQLTNPPRPRGENPEVRRVLVVISDGDDNQSHRARSEALDAVLRAGVVVYAISTSTNWVSPSTGQKYMRDEGDKVLDYFAEETGGRAFFPYRVDDLNQSFLDVGNELRSQYSLAFRPGNTTPDGRLRKIRIEVTGRGLTARGRKGFYIPRPASASAAPAPGETPR